jgi:hypothetical protein
MIKRFLVGRENILSKKYELIKIKYFKDNILDKLEKISDEQSIKEFVEFMNKDRCETLLTQIAQSDIPEQERNQDVIK